MKTTLMPWSLPPHYYGAHWDGYLVAPCSRNRDSDALERSNFMAQWEALKPTMADVPDEDASSPAIVRESHFLVGWVEWVAIHPSNAAAVKAAEEIGDRLERYPILDEDAFSSLEWEEYVDAWENYGKRDFADLIESAWGLPRFSADVLVDAPSLRDAYESGIPSGDYQALDSTLLKYSVARLTRDAIAKLLREGRKQR